ncbi:hypothetical protein Asppvi_002639 [Aspergillus pseudoviridinutans]|uniref:Uncharacterized protein n=1 Tax=Aspergillus pseudoviridinutans TaxID=1517512 RepID=A0A9P3B5F7_9EURO|nr:uncharacterized protein Asppvi_002639 [Aspergillus pseudoviridinutans]GIJ83809.1 hypothetical protein Asppvi_002639 [Aspergillus pseudoviridinutans]
MPFDSPPDRRVLDGAGNFQTVLDSLGGLGDLMQGGVATGYHKVFIGPRGLPSAASNANEADYWIRIATLDESMKVNWTRGQDE